MSGKRPGGLPTILLVDIPASVSEQIRFRSYLDRECVHASGIVCDNLDDLARVIHTVWRDVQPSYVIIDAPIETEKCLRELLRFRGMRVMMVSR